MRNFYNSTDEEGNPVIGEYTQSGNEQSCVILNTDEANAIIDAGEAILYNTQESMYEALFYLLVRYKSYPKVEDQLDQIFHEGIDAWKETIQAVKDAHPKPEKG